jgi:type II secretory pathway predicted ATPase ExeA
LYYPHFGLKEPPFKITPNTDFFFSGGNRGAILDALVYAITNGEGIIKVVGEVGSGKTMLCRMLQTILPEKIESIYLANPSVAPEDVLHAIAFELQLKLPKNADRLKVMQELQAYLLARYAEGRQVVIFVEEAQGMPLATLEEIRLLSNLETKQDKLLQIVLFGQPELDDNLNQEHIRQLRERITHRFNLGPLQTKDVGDYLIFRLRAAGYHGPHLFTESAIKKLSRASEGLVRRVNILADKALLSAFADNVYQVTPKHVHAAVNDSEFGVKPKWYQWNLAKTGSNYTWWAILLMAIVAIGILAAAFVYLSGSQPKPVVSANNQPAKKSTVLPVLTASTANATPSPLVDEQQLLVNQRLQATDNLLLSTSPETISLQIQSVSTVLTAAEQPQDALLKTALEKLRRQLEMDNIYLYRMQQNGNVYTVILYGAFAQRADALNALNGLPVEIRANQPYLRTLAGVKKDIEISQKIKPNS